MLEIDYGLTAADFERAPRGHVADLRRQDPVHRAVLRAGVRATVFTVSGRYTAQGWTEWTQGFQFGSAILQFDGTGDSQFLDLGRSHTMRHMAPHVTAHGSP